MRPRFEALAVRTLNAVLSALLGPPRRGFAHSLDELLQQMYVTPTEAGVRVEVCITPGELVAGDFAAVFDINMDGAISEAGVARQLEVLRQAVAIEFDEWPAPTRIVGSTPLVDVASSAGCGALDVAIEADAPADFALPWKVSVSNSYAPLDGLVQSNVTLSLHSTVTVTEMTRTTDGRTVQFTVQPR